MNSYIEGEQAEGPVSTEPQQTVLNLTWADVEQATGVAIRPGMVVEQEYALGVFRVRVRTSPTGDLVTGWIPISPS